MTDIVCTIFFIIKVWKQSKMFTNREWLNKLQNVNWKEYYEVIKMVIRKIMQPHGKNIYYIILSGRKKKQNTKLNLGHHCNYVKMCAHESRHQGKGRACDQLC